MTDTQRKLSRREVEELVRVARGKGERPDLKGAALREMDLHKMDLYRADLIGADLSVTDLIGANLIGANLSRANLVGANLSRAHLIGANLSRAYLIGANLNGADLRGANLSAADLHDANLSAADLIGADLSGVQLWRTIFIDADLSEVKGLETVRHLGPSEIGINTLFRSKVQFPESFLRGWGVPEILITYLPSMLGQPIQYYSCFISYSVKDTPFAKRLHADLQQAGIRCWFAPEDMKIGDKLKPRIDEVIRMHEKLLLILSEHSLASDWVEYEVKKALKQERERKEAILFPVRLDQAVMQSKEEWAAKIRERHIGDFRDWEGHTTYQKAFERLLRDLKMPAAGTK